MLSDLDDLPRDERLGGGAGSSSVLSSSDEGSFLRFDLFACLRGALEGAGGVFSSPSCSSCSESGSDSSSIVSFILERELGFDLLFLDKCSTLFDRDLIRLR